MTGATAGINITACLGVYLKPTVHPHFANHEKAVKVLWTCVQNVKIYRVK
jgi:hypothetical protein